MEQRDRLDGFRRVRVMESCYLAIFGGAVAAALLVEGFAGTVHLAFGVIGIVVALGVLVLLPRAWRGGWIDFGTDALELHSAWGPARRVPYRDVESVEVFAGRRTAYYGRRVQYVPSIVKVDGRRVLLNDFRGMTTPIAGAEVSPALAEAVERIRQELARARRHG